MYLPLAIMLLAFTPESKEERVVFFVQPYMDESGWYAEPISRIAGSKFTSIVDQDDTTFASHNAFSRKYFAPHERYTVYVNDDSAGSMSVISRDSEFACMQITAQVYYQGGYLGDGGLSFAGFKPLRSFSSFQATSRDSARALELARTEFKRKGVPAAAMRELQLNRIRSVDLNGDSQAELIATFETTQLRTDKDNIQILTTYFLALIYEAGKITYSYYSTGDEGTIGSVRQDIAGISDLDADGIAEVIFRNFYYESWDYSIVQWKESRWQKVWQGGGGGC